MTDLDHTAYKTWIAFAAIVGIMTGSMAMYLYMDNAMHKQIAQSAFTMGQADETRAINHRILDGQMNQIVRMEANRPNPFMNTAPVAEMAPINITDKLTPDAEGVHNLKPGE